MSLFYVLLEKQHSGFSPIIASGVVSGNNTGVRGKHMSFASQRELEDRLEKAGVETMRHTRELQALVSGIPTFIRLSVEQAHALDLIEDDPPL